MRTVLFLFIFLQSFSAFAQRTCGADHIHRHKMATDPNAKRLAEEIEAFTGRYIEQKKLMKAAGEDIEIIIPVVFHVVYYSQSQNISDIRLNEQIEILNKDFNALNSDLINVPSPFQSSIGKISVKFVLANRDPQGRITSGITRTKTTKTTSFTLEREDVKSASTGGVSAWDTKSYLNIWVCNLGGNLLGYASFPYEAGTREDGVVLNYRYVGVTGAISPYNFGRTATHEVGHYLNLFHIWGDANDCTADDGVTDTPKQYTYSSGIPTFPSMDQCTKEYPGNMFMNFMDYSFDITLLMFTRQQADRMMATLSGPRASLLSSKGYIPPKDFDLSTYIIESPQNIVCDNIIEPALNIVSLGNEKITSFNVSMQIDGGAVITKTWTGQLNLYDILPVSFDPVELDNGSHIITFSVRQPNGRDDDDLTNDLISKVFNVGVNSVSLPLTEDFESLTIANKGFTIVNPDNALTWTRSSLKAAKSGSYSIFMNNNEYDPDKFGVDYGEKDDIELPFLDFTDEEEIAMSFELAAAQYTAVTQASNNWDTLQVLVSLDCGSTYEIVYNKYAGTLITVPSAIRTFFTPTSAQWRTDYVDLSKFAGYNNVKVVIRNISHFENNIYIDDLNVYKGKVVSAREYVLDRDIDLYPNPGKGLVTIKVNDPAVRLKQVAWINTLGQTIMEEQANTYSGTLQFNLSANPKGMYIVRLLFEDGSVTTRKFILE